MKVGNFSEVRANWMGRLYARLVSYRFREKKNLNCYVVIFSLYYFCDSNIDWKFIFFLAWSRGRVRVSSVGMGNGGYSYVIKGKQDWTGNYENKVSAFSRVKSVLLRGKRKLGGKVKWTVYESNKKSSIHENWLFKLSDFWCHSCSSTSYKNSVKLLRNTCITSKLSVTSTRSWKFNSVPVVCQ